MAVGGYYGYAPRGSGARLVWRPGSAAGPAGPGVTAPRPPSSFYNPYYDVQLAEGKQSSGFSEADARLGKERLEHDFATGEAKLKQGYERGVSDTNEQRQKALRNLAESYRRLGVRQNEGANTAGVLYGGALLQAAAKRGRNQGVQVGDVNQSADLRLKRLGEDYSGELGSLAQLKERVGRGEIDYKTAIERAGQQNRLFTSGIEKLINKEATEHGYTSPPNLPGLPGGVVRKTVGPKRRGGIWYRVGGR